MVFNSFFFLLVFLPILVAGWFGLNRIHKRAAELFLIGMSLWFYGSFSVWYLPVLAVSIAINYLAGMQMSRQAARHKKRYLFIGIILNLLLLSWFKYVTPVLSAEVPSGRMSGGLSLFLQIGLPVGLSFYTFSQISYLIDLWRGEIKQDGFLTYLLYITYFPKIAEGPITKYEEIVSQFRDEEKRHPNEENLIRGLILLFLGMGKKLLIADVLAPAASFGLQSAYYLDTLSVLLTMVSYALQLYYDFSGFCDMAMGVSKMLNIELPLNFDAPFRSVTFSDFWKRWHMTLTRFFTQYVYIPLGGSRCGRVRTGLNIMIVFLLSALWHGTGATYLLWGIVSGLLVVLCSLGFGKRIHLTCKQSPGTVPVFRGLTFALFAFTLIFFGAGNAAQSFAILRNLFRPLYPGWLYRIGAQMDIPEFWVLNKMIGRLAPSASSPARLLELILVAAVGLWLALGKKTAVQYAQTMRFSTRNAVRMAILGVWCLTSLSGVTTYLYFRF